MSAHSGRGTTMRLILPAMSGVSKQQVAQPSERRDPGQDNVGVALWTSSGLPPDCATCFLDFADRVCNINLINNR